jgi:DNA modification methylase
MNTERTLNPKSEAYNIDCMEFMKTLPDKCFGLTIADPPYGVSYARGKNGWGVCDNKDFIQKSFVESYGSKFADKLLSCKTQIEVANLLLKKRLIPNYAEK